MATDNATLARRYLTEIWGKGNTQLIDELVDDEIVLGDPMTDMPARGKAALKQRVEMMSNEMADGSLAIEELVVAGEVAAARTRWTATHKKEFFGVDAKGKRMKCDAVEWIRIKNGKVVENISYFDVYELFEQIGALPPPEQLRSKQPAPTAEPARA